MMDLNQKLMKKMLREKIINMNPEVTHLRLKGGNRKGNVNKVKKKIDIKIQERV